MKNKSIAKTKIIQTVITTVAIIAGAVFAVQSLPRMDVDGVTCTTFSGCQSLADAGSVWTITGDWSSSGKLSITRGDITVKANNAKLQSVTVSGNNVTLDGFEVAGSPAGTNGIFWTGENGMIENIICHDSGLTCIRLYTSFNTTVQNSIVFDNLRGVPGNSDGVNCSGGGNNIFLNIDTSNNGDDGMDVWNCSANTIRYNNAHHNCGLGDQNGFKLGPAGENIVEYNTASYNCKDGFASNEGRNTFNWNTSDHNKRHGFSEWCGTSCGSIKSVYTNNRAFLNGGKNFSDTTGGWVIYGVGNTTATPINTTASSTPIPPTATFTPTVTSTVTPIPPTKTPTPFVCPTGLVLMEDDRLLICYRVK